MAKPIAECEHRLWSGVFRAGGKPRADLARSRGGRCAASRHAAGCERQVRADGLVTGRRHLGLRFRAMIDAGHKRPTAGSWVIEYLEFRE